MMVRKRGMAVVPAFRQGLVWCETPTNVERRSPWGPHVGTRGKTSRLPAVKHQKPESDTLLHEQMQ